MKIEEAVVRMGASREFSRQHEIESESTVSFRGLLQAMRVPEPAAAAKAESGEEDERRVRLMLQQLVASIIEMLTGEKCRCRVDDIAALPEKPAGEAGGGGGQRAIEWHHRVVERIAEHESTDFSAAGKIRTADGREIDFDLSLSMCRDYQCVREYEEKGKAVFRDPLVINFEGKAADLTDMRFDFDLDADGSAESLPVLARGSAYLALDSNGDGCINDGRELFGACTGDGFAELARHDADANGWIDEADPVYAALGVWFPDGELKSLKESGVGALHLGSVATQFSLTDDDNRARGQIRETGIYLNEDGSVGTLQQIDLAVLPAERTTSAATAAT